MPLAWRWKNPNTCCKIHDKKLCICWCLRGRTRNNATLYYMIRAWWELVIYCCTVLCWHLCWYSTSSSQQYYGTNISCTMDEHWALTVLSISGWMSMSLQILDLGIKQDFPKATAVKFSHPAGLKETLAGYDSCLKVIWGDHFFKRDLFPSTIINPSTWFRMQEHFRLKAAYHPLSNCFL